MLQNLKIKQYQGDEDQDMIEIFGRELEDGTITVLTVEDGESVTRIQGISNRVCPVGSIQPVSTEHPEGIVITAADAIRIGLAIGDDDEDYRKFLLKFVREMALEEEDLAAVAMEIAKRI